MIVLDTHAWIWMVSTPTLLSSPAQKAISESSNLGISVISCWEVSMLVQKGRVDLDRETLDWVKYALSQPKVKLLPLTPEIAVCSTQLSESLSADPSDLMIMATALEYKTSLLTKDGKISSSKIVHTIW